MTILEQVAARHRFTPTNPSEYLALQIARKLNDVASLRHYLVLFENSSEDFLLDVYRRCREAGMMSGEHFMSLVRENSSTHY